jgi:hypothetical protein
MLNKVTVIFVNFIIGEKPCPLFEGVGIKEVKKKKYKECCPKIYNF